MYPSQASNNIPPSGRDISERPEKPYAKNPSSTVRPNIKPKSRQKTLLAISVGASKAGNCKHREHIEYIGADDVAYR